MSLLSYLLHQEDHKCELLLVNTGMGLVETLCDLHAGWPAQHFQAVNLSNRSNAHQAPVLSDHKSIDCKGCNRRFHCLDTAGRRTANFGLKQQSNTNSSHHHPTPRHLGLRLTKNLIQPVLYRRFHPIQLCRSLGDILTLNSIGI